MVRSAGALRVVWRTALGIAVIVSLSCLLLGQQTQHSDPQAPTFTFTSPSGDVWLAEDGGEDGGNNGKQSIYLPGHIFMIPTSYFAGDTVFLQARRADSSGTTNLRIRTYDEGDLTEALMILGNGDVGIGQLSPRSRLHVQGPRINDATGSTAGGVLRIRDDAGREMVLDGNQLESIGNSLFLNHRTDNDIILAAGGGNIGIRTGNPTSPLTVAGVIETTTGGIKFPDGTIQTTAAADQAAASRGTSCSATGIDATIGGGRDNTASGETSTIAGGRDNVVSGQSSTVGGGIGNQAAGHRATVSGGGENAADFHWSTVGGGRYNYAAEMYSTIAGGDSNQIHGQYGAIPGGSENQANGTYSFAAGYRAIAYGVGCFVWSDSTEDTFESTGDDQFLIRASGGVGINTNEPTSTLTVAGMIESTEGGIVFPDGSVQVTAFDAGFQNTVAAWAATVAGGEKNTAYSRNSTVGGGLHNTAGSEEFEGGFATVAGGLDNQATHKVSTVGGGEWNYAKEQHATVGGGFANRATAMASTIAGGSENEAFGEGSFVGGGTQNDAAGMYSVVPGGHDNLAVGTCSFAGGMHAQAWYDGTFVWADYSIAGDPDGPHSLLAFPEQGDPKLQGFLGPNQFLVRATGGALFASGVDGEGNVTAGVKLEAGASSWDVLSDRNLKADVAALDRQEILKKLSAIPIAEWSLVAQDASIRHVGPMAQDFHAAFGLGTSDRWINSGDIDGIALISIQALHEISQEQVSEIEALRGEIDDLLQRLEQLERIVTQLGGAGS